MIKNKTAICSVGKTEEYRKNGVEWNFHDEDTQQHLHALHPYPARFIPQIPRQAIMRWANSGDTILDPFCGCGTTLLESSLLGRPAIGIDNNEIACLISRAKTTRYSSADVQILNEFTSNLEDILQSYSSDYWTPNYNNFLYWFDEKAIIDLGRLRTAIDDLSKNPKLLSLAVFSSIIVRASNQYSDTRYVHISKFYISESAIKWFKAKLKDTIDRLNEIIDLPRECCKVYLDDTRNMHKIDDESISLIVTSPPYLNAYDYHKYHRHRLHWVGGNVEFARDYEIGKHDVFTRPRATPDRYFEDMKQCFSEFYRVLNPRGRALVVIGDAIVSGKPVPVGDLFVKICQNIGLECENRYIREIPKNRKSFNQQARINEEHILLFKRT